jgi:hypothetical protein
VGFKSNKIPRWTPGSVSERGNGHYTHLSVHPILRSESANTCSVSRALLHGGQQLAQVSPGSRVRQASLSSQCSTNNGREGRLSAALTPPHSKQMPLHLSRRGGSWDYSQLWCKTLAKRLHLSINTALLQWLPLIIPGCHLTPLPPTRAPLPNNYTSDALSAAQRTQKIQGKYYELHHFMNYTLSNEIFPPYTKTTGNFRISVPQGHAIFLNWWNWTPREA